MLEKVGYAGALLARETPDGLELIDGHLRQEITGSQEVPVLVLDVDEEEAALILATLDPLGAMAEVDEQVLFDLLQDVMIPDAGLAAMLTELTGKAGLAVGQADPDEVPEPPEEPSTRPGDLYLLGEHLLLCGDATNPIDLARLTAGDVVEAMFTDPPWNVAIGQDSNPRHRQREGLQNDSMSGPDFAAFLGAFASNVAPVVQGDVYCVLGASEWPRLDQALRDAGYHWSATIIWVKDIFVLGRSKYHRRYEPLWYGWHEKGTSSFRAGRDQDDVWEIPRPRRSEEHPTMKPVALVERAIENSVSPGGTILDPFCGSGTTLIAAEQLQRRCLAMEIDPAYCDVIVARWEQFTGRSAERQTDADQVKVHG